MMKPEFSKPFDLASARAGAPFCGANGEAVRVLLWDRKHPTHPIIAIEEAGEQEAVAFRADGTSNARESLCVVSQLVMLPLALVEGKPVFVGDEIEAMSVPGSEWISITVKPGDRPRNAVFRWPAPAKVYPETLMGNNQLHAAFIPKIDGVWNSATAKNIANAALRHAIDSEQVILPGEVLEVARRLNKSQREAREMAIAKAVLAECMSYASPLANIDLAAIIATIK
jgi:hypothetical protein